MYIDLETAKLAKEHGFIENCDYYTFYDGVAEKDTVNNESVLNVTSEDHYFPMDTERHVYYPAPQRDHLQEWLREKHNINVIPMLTTMLPNYCGGDIDYTYSICFTDNGTPVWLYDIEEIFETYDSAFERGLQEALKQINEKTEEILISVFDSEYGQKLRSTVSFEFEVYLPNNFDGRKEIPKSEALKYVKEYMESLAEYSGGSELLLYIPKQKSTIITFE